MEWDAFQPQLVITILAGAGSSIHIAAAYRCGLFPCVAVPAAERKIVMLYNLVVLFPPSAAIVPILYFLNDIHRRYSNECMYIHITELDGGYYKNLRLLGVGGFRLMTNAE